MERCRRIRRDDEFRRVRQRGRCWSTDTLTLCALATGAPLTRVGFVISKRVGGAVIRNRTKRRLRESARHLLPTLIPGHDLVIIARPPLAQCSLAEMNDLLLRLTRRARLALGGPPPARPETVTAPPTGDTPR